MGNMNESNKKFFSNINEIKWEKKKKKERGGVRLHVLQWEKKRRGVLHGI